MKRWIFASPLALPLVAFAGWLVDPSHATFWASGLTWTFLGAVLALPSIVASWPAAAAAPEVPSRASPSRTTPSPATASQAASQASPRRSGAGSNAAPRVTTRRLLRWGCIAMCTLSLLALIGSFTALVVWPEQSDTWTWTIMASMLSLLVWAPALALSGDAARPEPADFIPSDYFDRPAYDESPRSNATGDAPRNASGDAASTPSARSLWPDARDSTPRDSAPHDSNARNSNARNSNTGEPDDDAERMELESIWAAASARISGDAPPRASSETASNGFSANGSSANGASSNGASSNGASSNGSSVNGASARTGSPPRDSSGPPASTDDRKSLWPPVDAASDDSPSTDSAAPNSPAPDSAANASESTWDDADDDAWDPGDWPDFRYDLIAEEG